MNGVFFKSKINYLLFVWFVLFSCNPITKDGSSTDSVVIHSDRQSLVVENSLNKRWEGYSFTDDEVRQFPDRIEQSLVDYLSQFPSYTKAEVDSSLCFLIKKTESSELFFRLVSDKFSYYLYHPNSPMRNDLWYEQVLRSYLSCSKLEDVDRERKKMLLELLIKNQVGTVVANFSFVERTGVERDVVSFIANYKLLVFYDPTCVHCDKVIFEMKNSEILNNAIDSDEIVVLAIDPLGDFEKWKSYQSKIPDNWINGYDHVDAIVKKSIFNIQAYPTIYLLDKDNVVVLKDVYFNQIEEILKNDLR